VESWSEVTHAKLVLVAVEASTVPVLSGKPRWTNISPVLRWLAGRAWLDSEAFCRPQCFVVGFPAACSPAPICTSVRRFLVHLGSFGRVAASELTLVALRAWLLAPPGLPAACRAALVYFLCELSSWGGSSAWCRHRQSYRACPCHLHDAAPSLAVWFGFGFRLPFGAGVGFAVGAGVTGPGAGVAWRVWCRLGALCLECGHLWPQLAAPFP